MKYLRLILVSIVVFSLLLWGITLLFPSDIVISRASNHSGKAKSLFDRFESNEISLQTMVQHMNPDQPVTVKTADIPFYSKTLFNILDSASVPNADTLFFRFQNENQETLNGGLAFYQLSEDSSTIQAFYVLHEPWYKPVNKFRLMVADKTHGPGLDSILVRLKQYE